MLYKRKNTRIYDYTYTQLFPFHVIESPYTNSESSTFIHSKVYLIDDKIAYLGSLNFTYSGTKNNHETRVRTTDIEAIEQLRSMFNELPNEPSLPKKSITEWGRQIYPEPIN